jgi:hypothetical protein
MKKLLICCVLFTSLFSCEREPLIFLNPDVSIEFKEEDEAAIYLLVDINANPSSSFDGAINPKDVKLSCLAEAHVYDVNGVFTIHFTEPDGLGYSESAHSYTSENEFNPKFCIVIQKHEANNVDYASLNITIEGYFTLAEKTYSFLQFKDDF